MTEKLQVRDLASPNFNENRKNQHFGVTRRLIFVITEIFVTTFVTAEFFSEGFFFMHPILDQIYGFFGLLPPSG